MWIVKKDNPLHHEGFDAEKFYAPILKHISDSRLRKLYFDIWNDPFAALQEGDRLLVDALDKCAILSPMWEAAQHIIVDLEENPTHEGEKYGGHGLNFFIDARNRIEHELEILKRNGFTDTVYERYEKRFHEELKKHPSLKEMFDEKKDE
ncbi:MAG: hypothetical protein AABW68_02400 [archaeon]